MKTNKAKIKQFLIKNGSITKAQAGGYRWTYGLGEVIRRLRKELNIETIMLTNPKTGNQYAKYVYIGVK